MSGIPATIRMAVTILSTGLAACSSSESDEPSRETLATTAYVKVGNRTFAVPISEVAAVWRGSEETHSPYLPRDEDVGKKDAERLAGDAGRSSKPIVAAGLEIAEYPRVETSYCSDFGASWFCKAERIGAVSDLPTTFRIRDLDELGHGGQTSTGESFNDNLAAVSRASAGPMVACGTTGFCIATIRVSPGIIAVWNSYPRTEPPETPQAMAERQGRAIIRAANGRYDPIADIRG